MQLYTVPSLIVKHEYNARDSSGKRQSRYPVGLPLSSTFRGSRIRILVDVYDHKRDVDHKKMKPASA